MAPASEPGATMPLGRVSRTFSLSFLFVLLHLGWYDGALGCWPAAWLG